MLTYNIYASSVIRTHDLSVGADEYIHALDRAATVIGNCVNISCSEWYIAKCTRDRNVSSITARTESILQAT
jgi:hypothetical protein